MRAAPGSAAPGSAPPTHCLAQRRAGRTGGSQEGMPCPSLPGARPQGGDGDGWRGDLQQNALVLSSHRSQQQGARDKSPGLQPPQAAMGWLIQAQQVP